MTTTTTKPTLWVEYDGDIDDVAPAIEAWHVEHDLAIPADDQFLRAVMLVHAGTSIRPTPDTRDARAMRVVMPCGNVYTLSVESDADYDDGWRASHDYCVDSAEVVK